MKLYAVLGLAVTLANATLGCSGSLTPTPTVYVDGAFTAEETEAVVSSLTAWSARVPGLSFRMVTEPHDSILAHAGAPAGNSVFVLAGHGKSDAANCPLHAGVPEGEAAWTFQSADAPAICVDVDDIRNADTGDVPYGAYVTYLAGHEIGHAMGLLHSHDAGDIMAPHTTAFPAGPSCSDAERMAARWGLGSVCAR